METKEYNTPMMRQYLSIKNEYSKEILFFRMGDFYEMFFDDAVYASRVLGIALTKRQDGIPMCGVPYHAVSNYIHPILDDGRNIAICEQLEKPEEAEGTIVKRGVVRVLTPGTIFEENLLDQTESRWIASVVLSGDSITAVLADVSTGDIRIEKPDNISVLAERGVREVVLSEENEKYAPPSALPLYFRKKPPEGKAREVIEKSYKMENLQVLELSDPEQEALALLFLYIMEVIPRLQNSWKKPRKEYLRKIMHLDETAIKTLELIQSQSGERNSSLLGVLDKTVTAYGRRLLIDFITKPSLDKEIIKSRQSAIRAVLDHNEFFNDLKSRLRHIYDIERVLSHLQNHPQVRHLGHVLTTFQIISEILDEMLQADFIPQAFRESWKKEKLPSGLMGLLESSLFMEELPPILDERRFVKPGYSRELDELLDLGGSAGDVILEFEKREKARLDIPTLKVRYNKVIGYFIEISKGQSDKAPADYTRRQTLVNAERFTCEELKNLEERILGSRERIIDLQGSIFESLVEKTLEEIETLRYWADACAFFDVILSLSRVSEEGRYICPEITDDGSIEVEASRHPVVENLFREEVFVPNDIHLNNDNRHLAILTGPNMAGKSTYIRQVGLIQILAQMGSFVPAKSAKISLADRIFTRIGAFDRLSRGESTFYVEMAECARIFQNFTADSLILLDEIGRGTSTFDGISIARAMVEYLNAPSLGRPKTLFATHYGELGGLIEKDRGIIGLTVDVLEDKDQIFFLRKIKEGIADKSYGIYVAQLAGIRPEIINRASELLKELESDGIWSKEPVFKENAKIVKTVKQRPPKDQLSMF